MKKIIFAICTLTAALAVASCFSAKGGATAAGGEVTGVSGTSMAEPAPFGMVLVKRGSLKMGSDKSDSLWGKDLPTRDISVDAFWMDEKEVTNSMYRQFVYWVRDSIIRERLADPAYGGDETYKIEEDRYGEPVTPHLNWNKALPRNPDEDQLRAIESVYTTHPVTGEKMLDVKQLNYRYEVFDYVMAAKRKYRLNPEERYLNTDVQVDPEEQKRQQENLLRRRSFVPSLIGAIGSLALSIHSALNYLINIFLLNSQYNAGIIGYDIYLEDAAQVLTSTGVYLFLATLMGSVLGIIGLVASNKSKNTKGKILGTIAVVVAVIALTFSVLCFVFRAKVVGA